MDMDSPIFIRALNLIDVPFSYHLLEVGEEVLDDLRDDVVPGRLLLLLVLILQVHPRIPCGFR